VVYDWCGYYVPQTFGPSDIKARYLSSFSSKNGCNRGASATLFLIRPLAFQLPAYGNNRHSIAHVLGAHTPGRYVTKSISAAEEVFSTTTSKSDCRIPTQGSRPRISGDSQHKMRSLMATPNIPNQFTPASRISATQLLLSVAIIGRIRYVETTLTFTMFSIVKVVRTRPRPEGGWRYAVRLIKVPR
jgi:hypothetical protein